MSPAGASPTASAVDVVSAGGGAATLAHDAAGQLVGVVTHTGAVYRYAYDAAGNTTAVTSLGTPPVAALSVVPQRARAGETVTVTGKGFSTVLANNQVTMGGVAATVTAASASTISFRVPAVASGAATITTPAGSGTTPTITVLSGTAPVVSGFTPAYAAPGDQVTVTATGLASDTASNLVRINGLMAGIVSRTGGTIVIEVPDGVGSGPISITTPYGKGVSATDLRVVPAGLDPANTLGPVRLTVGTAKALTVPAGKTLLATFATTGAAGYSVVGSTSAGNADIYQAMYDALNIKQPVSSYSSSAGAIWSEPNILVSEDYATVSLTNRVAVDKVVTLTVHRVVDVNAGAIALNGTAKTLATTTPGQQAYATFGGTAGQRVSFEGGPASVDYGYLKLVAPDGSQLASRFYSSSPSFQDPLTLPATGTYKLVWDPRDANVSSTPVKAWTVPADVNAGAIALNGTAKTLATTTPGQQAYATFSGTAGQRVSFQGGPASVDYGYLKLVAPDGTQLASRFYAGQTAFQDPVVLPATGTYKFVWDPRDGNVSSSPVKAWTVPADVNAGAIALTGTAKTLAITTPGQQAYATFAGTAGQRVSFQGGPASVDYGHLKLVAPDGSQLASRFYAGQTSFQDPVTLPVAGTYKLVWDPRDGNVSSSPVKAWTVPADVNAGAIALNGTAKTLAITKPGQQAYATFSGTAGQRVSFQGGPASLDYGYLKLVAPDGSQLASRFYSTAASFQDPVTLPVAGTYKLVWDPRDGNVSSSPVKAWNVPADANAGTIALNGTAKTLSVATPGQKAYATFTAATGTFTVTVSLAGTTCCKQVGIVNAAGATVASRNGNGTFSFTGGTGTWKVVLDPSAALTGSVTVKIVKAAATAPARTAAADSQLVGTSDEAAGPRRTERIARETRRRDVAAEQRQRAADAATRRTHAPAWSPSQANLAGEDWAMHTPAVAGAEPLAGPAGATALSGVVRDLDGRGVGGIDVEVQGHTVRTDARGRFLLVDLAPGKAVVTVDGTAATFPDRSYGVFRVPVDLRDGRTTTLANLWFPRLDMRHTVRISSPLAEDVTLRNPDIPGLEVRIPRGSVIRDHHGRVVTELGITALPTNRLPYGMPNQGRVPVYFTVQPGGATIFPSGAQVVYPNYTREQPGSEVSFIAYDPAAEGWHDYGKGRVTDDGRSIEPDADTRVWSMDGFSIGIGGLPLPDFGWWQDFVDWLSGDPVEVSTGKLTDSHTDLAVDDVIPIEITRHHWQGDGAARNFGLNTRLGYDWYLDQTVYHQEVNLYLPSGGMVHFSPSPNPTADVDLVAVNAPPEFEGAHLVTGADRHSFDLRLRNGDVWSFPWQSRPRWMEDRHGNRVTFIRPSDNGEVTRIISPSGRWIALSYDASKRVTSVRDNGGRTVRYTYDAAGRLETVTDPATKVRRYTYVGTTGQIASISDARGVKFLDVTYDAAGRVAKQVLPNGAEFLFAYTTGTSGAITQTRVTQPNGSVTAYDFGTDGRPHKVTEAFGTALARATTFTRSPSGRVDAVTDHAGRRTEYAYDALNRPIQSTILAGTAAARIIDKRTYGPYDQPASITDASGKVTSFTYDAEGDLATIKDPLGRITTYTSNARGLPTSIRTHGGRLTTMTYTSGTIPESVTDPAGRVTKVFRDALGRPVEVLDPAGNRSYTSYDALNNPVQQTDPLGRIVKFEYDENGNLTRFTDGRQNSTSWTYDDANNQRSMLDPLGRTETADYDSSGRLTATTARSGLKTEFSYDLLDRTTEVRYGVTATGEDSTVTYAYDPVGRVESVTDSAAGTSSYTYSVYDEVLTETTPDGKVTTTYDAAARPVTVTNDALAPTVYDYDDAGQLAKITKGTDVTSFTYDGDGLLTLRNGPGGWTTDYTHDSLGQLTGIDFIHGGTTKGGLTYGYSAAGVRHSVGGSFANVTSPAPRAGMVYDAANRLTTNGAATLTYDADGNLLSDGTSTYTWDARGQLASVSRAGVNASFSYDQNGNRRARTVNSATRTWLHNGANPVVEKTNGSVTGELGAAGVDGWLSRRSGGTTDTVLTDAVGSPVAFARADGSITARMSYDPFGAQATSGDLRGSDLGFTGRQVDGTGLLFYRARYYDPALGRFISEDPIGHAGGANLYGYVGNSPANATDPTGHVAQVVVACVGGAAFEALVSWGTQRLSGQKVDWGDVGKAAAVGCVAGALGYGAGMWLGSRFAAATTTSKVGWSLGDDIYALTKAGNKPAWTTVRTRFWKNEAANPKYGNWTPAQLARMRSGRAPQRYNPDKGGMESMDLSHEPIPYRDGGTRVIPRWPQDHAAIDPYRHPGY